MKKREAAPVFLGPLPAAHAPLLAELGRWVAQGWLRELDRSLAAFLAQQAPQADPLLILAAALASHQLGRGHACLDLQATLADAGQALSLPPDGAERAPAAVRPSASFGDAVQVGAATEPPAHPASLLAGVDLRRWQAALRHPAVVGEGPGATPLVLEGHRLYLRRYWQYEQTVRQHIAQRVATPTAAAGAAAQPLLQAALDTLFPHTDGAAADWQKMACALAARQGFAIITGGPGTGKTTTVVRLLALLQHLALAGLEGAAAAAAAGTAPRPLRIRLAAPTGKAAARLNESIAGAVGRLPVEALAASGLHTVAALRQAIPTEVTTVHRLLGSRPDTRHFRHGPQHPLPLDLLVIDEASMLDLEMAAAVLGALPPHARLILLGDKDQLASVEAGAVLGQLCQRADAGHYTAGTAAWLQATTGELLPAELCSAQGRPLDQAIAKLRISHRFSAESGIGLLAEAVNRGDPARVHQVLQSGRPDLAYVHLGPQARRAGLPAGAAPPAALAAAAPGEAALRALVVEGAPESFANAGAGRLASATGQPLPPPVGYHHYLHCMRSLQPAPGAPQAALDDWARAVLAAYGQFQLLCALRSGPQGVEGLNARIAALLRQQGLLEPEQAGWYPGRPVLVTRNDYSLGLMNGDVGVALALPLPSGEPRAKSTGATAPASTARARWRLRVAFADSTAEGGIRWVLPSRLQSVETVFAMTVHKSQGSEFTHAALVLPERLSPVLTRELVYTGITRAKAWFTLATSGPVAVLDDAVRSRVVRGSGLDL